MKHEHDEHKCQGCLDMVEEGRRLERERLMSREAFEIVENKAFAAGQAAKEKELFEWILKQMENLPSQHTNHSFDRGWNHAFEFLKESVRLKQNENL